MAEIYLMPADDSSQFGTGTAENPIRIMPKPGDFDRWMQIIADREFIGRVALRGGVYETLGCWAYPPPFYSMAPRTMTIEGVDLETNLYPTIRLSPEAVFETDNRDRPDTQVMQLGRMQGDAPGMVIRKLKVDGNQSAFPSGRLVTAGIHLWGSHALVQDIISGGLRGNKDLQHEAFGVLLKARRDSIYLGPSGGSVVSNVSVYNDALASSYYSGLYAGYTDVGAGCEHTTVSDCFAESENGVSRLAFSFGSCVSFDRCEARKFSYGPYVDTGEADEVYFSGCTWRGLRHCAIRLAADGSERRNIAIHNCEFFFEPINGIELIGLEIVDTPSWQSRVNGLIARRCAFDLAGAARRFVAVSIAAKEVQNCRFLECHIPAESAWNASGETALVGGKIPKSTFKLMGCYDEAGNPNNTLTKL